MAQSEDWTRLRRRVDVIWNDYRHHDDCRPNPVMCALLILGEDRRFPYHPGFDPLALCRAAWRTFACGRQEGGSTIAMQLVRTLTRRRDRTILRKAQEIALAVRLTRYVPRKDLPGLYLWAAYYGWRMNNFVQACDRLVVDPAQQDLGSAARLVACLKYPQPREVSAKRLDQIEHRCIYLIRRYNQPKSHMSQEAYVETL